MSERPATILLVDDDSISILMMKRAIRSLQIANETVVARDGDEALRTLETARAETGDLSAPYIILLDVNMPRMNGFEFLESVQGRPDLGALEIFVFASPDLTQRSAALSRLRVSGLLCKDAPKETLRRAFAASGFAPQLLKAS